MCYEDSCACSELLYQTEGDAIFKLSKIGLKSSNQIKELISRSEDLDSNIRNSIKRPRDMEAEKKDFESINRYDR